MADPAAPLDPNTAGGTASASIPAVASAAGSPSAAEAPLATPGANPAAAAPAEAATVAAAPAAGETPKLEPTLLEKFDAEQAANAAADKAAKPVVDAKPVEAKPGEKPAVAAEKPKAAAAPEAKPAEPAAPVVPEPITYEYTLPETLNVDDAIKGRLHTALDSFRADPLKGSQALIDLHASTMAEFATATRKAQYDTFNETKSGWEKQILADPEFGGAGHNTAMKAVARTRDLTLSSAKAGTPRYESEREEFEQFLATTGAGSHPAFIRLLHNAARYIDEPQANEQPLADLKPPKGNGKSPGSKLYDHPSSQKVARN